MTTPKNLTPHQRLIVALDKSGQNQHPITTLPALKTLMHSLEEPLQCGILVKLRPAHLYRFKAQDLRNLHLQGPCLFIDAKLHDIGASATDDLKFFIDEFQPRFVTCHASLSPSALHKLANLCQGTTTTLIGVTVLTDIDDTKGECASIYNRPAELQVLNLVQHGLTHGAITHTVCSAQEAALVRHHFPQQIIITPGIRPQGSTAQDQKRTNTPAQAIANGADYLVIGRPITSSPNPTQTINAIADEIAQS